MGLTQFRGTSGPSRMLVVKRPLGGSIVNVWSRNTNWSARATRAAVSTKATQRRRERLDDTCLNPHLRDAPGDVSEWSGHANGVETAERDLRRMGPDLGCRHPASIVVEDDVLARIETTGVSRIEHRHVLHRVRVEDIPSQFQLFGTGWVIVFRDDAIATFEKEQERAVIEDGRAVHLLHALQPGHQ